MAPVGPSGRATPKPRIAPSIPMEMTDARGQRVTRTGITPMNGMTAVTAEDLEEELEIDDLPYVDASVIPARERELEFSRTDGHQSTLELEQIEAAQRASATEIPDARTSTGANKNTSGLTKAQQRAASAANAKSNNKKAKATRPPQRPILFGMGRDRLILLGAILLVLLVAIVATVFMVTRKPPVNPAVTPTATAKPLPSPTGFGDPTETPVPVPTNTPVPPPPSDVIAVGGWVQVTANVRVRSEATTSGAALGTLKEGTNGHVVDGPVQADGYTWWKIDSFDGADPAKSGWAAGEFLKPIPVP